MKLSEAIRLGAMLKPQGFSWLTNGRTCALGAASDAVGMIGDAVDFCGEQAGAAAVRMMAEYPILRSRVGHPVRGDSNLDLFLVIQSLNDGYGWTRERIADWVETIEAQHGSTPEPQPISVEA